LGLRDRLSKSSTRTPQEDCRSYLPLSTLLKNFKGGYFFAERKEVCPKRIFN
jgi:hypothetical protein